jgi:hypothetical protein
MKYISFREVDTKFLTIQRSEEVVASKGRDFVRNVCYPRSIAVYINVSETGLNIGGLKIRV